MLAVPKLTPVMRGGVEGAVAPAAMKRLDGLIVTLEVSLLDSVTKTPEERGLANVSVNERYSPGATVTPEASIISEPNLTVTAAVALETFGALV
jgi:hypothetical protein